MNAKLFKNILTIINFTIHALKSLKQIFLIVCVEYIVFLNQIKIKDVKLHYPQHIKGHLFKINKKLTFIFCLLLHIFILIYIY